MTDAPTALRRALLTILCLFPLSATVARAEPRASVDAIVQVTATVPNSARTLLGASSFAVRLLVGPISARHPSMAPGFDSASA